MFLEAGCFFDANRKSLNIRKFLMDRKIDTQLFRVIELGVMGYIVTYYVNTSQNNQALKKVWLCSKWPVCEIQHARVRPRNGYDGRCRFQIFNIENSGQFVLLHPPELLLLKFLLSTYIITTRVTY